MPIGGALPAPTLAVPARRLETRLRYRPITAWLLIAAAAIPLAACGGSSDNSATAKSGGSTSQPSGSTAQPSSPDAVTIDNFAFSPSTLTVSPGAHVTVANHDSTAHTATADNGSSFDTGNIDPGSSKTITLSKPGTYSYHCTIHPFMHGRIEVS
jgi:plastocyanin